ncbi:MAG: hypothetical protein JRN09_00205 [Nitrososphaerota archaeon]|nr:hypothetical protein [Nitrososphaerota archaeon]
MQVIKNYQKNKAFYKLIRFVVTSENHREQLYGILNEEQPPDPNKFSGFLSNAKNSLSSSLSVMRPTTFVLCDRYDSGRNGPVHRLCGLRYRS